jgi:UDP-N-acetylmuramyl pentapeptide phosphotransferase/UDP-N-acetylglucosamine-1-phosphate transferase
VSAFCALTLATALLSALFIGLAHAIGLTDDGRDAPGRKLQTRAVPLAGGAAILCGLALAPLLGGTGLEHLLHGRALAVLLGAFALGAIDDLRPRGLPVGIKFAGQIVLALGCASVLAEPGLCFVGATLFALVAISAWNTFDNADGAVVSLAALGSLLRAPLLAGVLLGFLPFNLWIRRPAGGGGPWSYLGDSGTHLLGVIFALDPGSWPVLLVPALDLARLSVVRLQRGSRPWIGDRRHLAHRLQARGLGPSAVAGVLVLLAAPAVLGAWPDAQRAWALPCGVALTVLASACACA